MRPNQFSTVRRAAAVAALAALLLAAPAPNAARQKTDYQSQAAEWRAEREAKLKADDGWLTLAGLFWLKEGPNSLGSAPENDVVLPANSAPARLGVLELRGGRAHLRVAEGSESAVTLDGKAVSERELRSDEDGAKPDVLRVGEASFQVIKRGERYGVRVKDKGSRARREFAGLKYYPANEELRVTAKFTPFDQPQRIAITSIVGDTERMVSPGILTFRLRGREYRLQPVEENGKLFIMFRDQTSGRATYPAGRFLYAALPKDGVVTLDFNQAFNPPCAFTEFATCPLPPKQNRLTAAIEAGELTYHQ